MDDQKKPLKDPYQAFAKHTLSSISAYQVYMFDI